MAYNIILFFLMCVYIQESNGRPVCVCVLYVRLNMCVFCAWRPEANWTVVRQQDVHLSSVDSSSIIYLFYLGPEHSHRFLSLKQTDWKG